MRQGWGHARVVCVLLLAFAPPELNVCSGAAVEAWQARARSIGLARSPGGRAVRAAPSGLRKAREDAVLASEVLLEDRPAAAGGGGSASESPPRASRALFPQGQAALGLSLPAGQERSLPLRGVPIVDNKALATTEREQLDTDQPKAHLYPPSRKSRLAPGQRKAQQCGHRGPDGDCKRSAYYGCGKGRKSVLWCREHRQPGDVDVRNRRCVRDGCNRFAVYGPCASPQSPKPGEGERASGSGGESASRAGRRTTAGVMGAALCARHRRKADKDLRSKRCQHPDGCLLAAKYGPLSQGIARFCKAHRVKGKHVYLASKRCEFATCLRAPSFGSAADFKARFCVQHKTDDDVYVKHRLCQHPEGCQQKARGRQRPVARVDCPMPGTSSSNSGGAGGRGPSVHLRSNLTAAMRTHSSGGEGMNGSGVGGGVVFPAKPPYCKICHRRALPGRRVCPHLRAVTAVTAVATEIRTDHLCQAHAEAVAQAALGYGVWVCSRACCVHVHTAYSGAPSICSKQRPMSSRGLKPTCVCVCVCVCVYVCVCVHI